MFLFTISIEYAKQLNYGAYKATIKRINHPFFQSVEVDRVKTDSLTQSVTPLLLDLIERERARVQSIYLFTK